MGWGRICLGALGVSIISLSLLGATKNGVGFRNFYEALGGLRIVEVMVGVVGLRERVELSGSISALYAEQCR